MSLNSTQIEWVRNPDGTPGYSWNPITGCKRKCEYCYARKEANRRLRRLYTEGVSKPALYSDPAQLDDPFFPRLWPQKLQEPMTKTWPYGRARQATSRQKPKGIFAVNMGEMFGPWVPDSWIFQVLNTIRACPQHRFYLLTKFPENLPKWQFPANAWVGASATDRLSFYHACDWLGHTNATLKYISLEPYLADILRGGGDLDVWEMVDALIDSGVAWMIIGARTKPLVLPEKEWIEDVEHVCGEAKIPMFLKDSLKPLYPSGLRQEVPDA